MHRSWPDARPPQPSLLPRRLRIAALQAVGAIHGRLVHDRRSERIASALAWTVLDHALTLGADASVAPLLLDIGCGDGRVGAAMASHLQGSVVGIDVLPRLQAAIPVVAFDGVTVPFGDGVVDYAVLSDVLHHTNDPVRLLREAGRVSRHGVVVKDHCAETWVDRATLAAMDWVGNAPHGVLTPHTYLSRADWYAVAAAAGLTVRRYERLRGLYAAPARWICERELHVTMHMVSADTEHSIRTGGRRLVGYNTRSTPAPGAATP